MSQLELNRRRMVISQVRDSFLEFSSPSSFTLAVNNTTKNWDGTLEYSTDKSTWSVWDGTATISSVSESGIHYIYLRGFNNTHITGSGQNRQFVLTGSDIECNGDIRSLLDYNDVTNTIMGEYCFFNLFSHCTSLIKAPDLPATTLSVRCYESMFSYCSSLVAAPDLPATTLESNCYRGMFSYCSLLTQSPIINATVLAENCCQLMFSSCTSLVKGPILKAATLVNECYKAMFANSSLLSEITMLATNISATECLYNWVINVAQTGIFYKNSEMSTLPTGTAGIPGGWTVRDYNP